MRSWASTAFSIITRGHLRKRIFLMFCIIEHFHFSIKTFWVWICSRCSMISHMFFHIFMRALHRGEEVPLFDDGEQTRDFTFCSDIVDGILKAAFYPGAGEVFNLGGGSETSLLQAIALVEKIAGRKANLKRFDRQSGDVRHTRARLEEARSKLGYSPQIGLEEGLARERELITTVAY